MTLETFGKALELVQRCGQNTAWLHNFGEPLLHPDLVDFIRRATAVGVVVSFYTNGLPLTDDLATRLVEAGLGSVCVADHVRGSSGRIQALIDRLGLPLSIKETYRPTQSQVHTWAGQVAPAAATSGFVHQATGPCLFQRQNAAVILWDGRVNVCCIDVEGDHATGTIDDYLEDPHRYRFQPIDLCDGCTLMRGSEDL